MLLFYFYFNLRTLNLRYIWFLIDLLNKPICLFIVFFLIFNVDTFLSLCINKIITKILNEPIQ